MTNFSSNWLIVSHTIFSEPEVLKLESRKKLQTLGHAPPYELYITFHLKYHIGLQTLIHTQRDRQKSWLEIIFLQEEKSKEQVCKNYKHFNTKKNIQRTFVPMLLWISVCRQTHIRTWKWCFFCLCVCLNFDIHDNSSYRKIILVWTLKLQNFQFKNADNFFEIFTCYHEKGIN